MSWRIFGPIAIALGLSGCALDPAGASDDAPPLTDAGADATVPDAASAIDGSVDVDAVVPGDGSDATTSNDALPIADTSVIDVADVVDANIADVVATDAPCPGALCEGVCLAKLDCTACAAAPLYCASTRSCTTDCATCAATGSSPARPVECFRCDVNRLNPIGTCEPRDPNLYCLNGSAYGTAYHCGCSDTVPCPGRTLVCTDISVGVPVCATCGEPLSDQRACAGGGQCVAVKGTCE